MYSSPMLVMLSSITATTLTRITHRSATSKSRPAGVSASKMIRRTRSRHAPVPRSRAVAVMARSVWRVAAVANLAAAGPCAPRAARRKMPAMPGPGDVPGAVGSRRPAHGWLPRPSPIEWLCLAAGLALTLHYAWVLDDAYVYFRYVDNLLFLDRGLVYNPGEYVEGYSSPLWLLLLAALRATELNFWILVHEEQRAHDG